MSTVTYFIPIYRGGRGGERTLLFPCIMCYVLNRHLQYRFTKTVNLYESHTTRIKTTFAWLVRASTGVWNSVTWLHFEPKDTSPQPKIRSPLDFHNGNWMELSSSTVHRSEINMIKTKLWRNRGFIGQNLFASTSGNAASKCFRIWEMHPIWSSSWRFFDREGRKIFAKILVPGFCIP